jgi:hypothetical protein
VETLFQRLTYKRTTSIYGVPPDGEYYTQQRNRSLADVESMKLVMLRRVKWWVEGYDVASEEFQSIEDHVKDEVANQYAKVTPARNARAQRKKKSKPPPEQDEDDEDDEDNEDNEDDNGIGPLPIVELTKPPTLLLLPELVPCCLSDAQLDHYKQEMLPNRVNRMLDRVRQCRAIIDNAVAIDEQTLHCLLINVAFWNDWSRRAALGQAVEPVDGAIFQNTLSKHPLYLQFETVWLGMASDAMHLLRTEGYFSSNFSVSAQAMRSLNLHRNAALQTFHSLKSPHQSGARQSVPLPLLSKLLPFFKSLDRVGRLMFDALVMVEHFASSMAVLTRRGDSVRASLNQKKVVLGACRQEIHRLYHAFDSSFARLLFACRNRSQWTSSGMLGLDDFNARIQAAAKQVVIVRDSWKAGTLGVFVGIVGTLLAQQFNNPSPELKPMLQRSVEWIKAMKSAIDDNDDIDDIDDNDAPLAEWDAQTKIYFENACKYHTESFAAVLSGYALIYTTAKTLDFDYGNTETTIEFLQEFDTMHAHRETSKTFVLKCMLLREAGINDPAIIAKELAVGTIAADGVDGPGGYARSQGKYDAQNAALGGREQDYADPISYGG